MEYKRLSDHEHYYYTHSDFFIYPSDFVHAFLMEDYDIGMHEQEFYEINLITSGEGIHYINDRRVGAAVGDVFIIPPNISHGYVGGENFDVFHVILSDAFMTKYIADLQQMPSFYILFGAEPLMRGRTKDPLHLKLSNDELVSTINVMQSIAIRDRISDTVNCLIRSNLAMVAIGLLCNAYKSEDTDTYLTPSEDHALMKSISYIHERYYEKITVEDLASIAHMSRSSYLKKFGEICKMSPSAYLIKIRLESAAVMLSSTDLSISDIAYKTGFYDASHFTRAFEKAYATSPMAYRNRRSKGS